MINLPIGLLALPGAVAAYRAGLGTPADRDARLDLPGLVLLATGLGLATYGVERATGHGWANPWWPSGLVLLAGYVLWARARPRAALDLDLVRDPARALTLGLCMVSSIVLFSVLFLAPLYLQSIQHHSTAVIGLVLLPQGLAMGLSASAATKVVERFSVRAAVITGMLFLAIMTGAMALFTTDTPVWLTTLVLCGRGLAIGLTSQPLVLSLLATFYAARGAATGSPLTGLRESALILAAAALAGAAWAVRLRRPASTRAPVAAH